MGLGDSTIPFNIKVCNGRFYNLMLSSSTDKHIFLGHDYDESVLIIITGKIMSYNVVNVILCYIMYIAIISLLCMYIIHLSTIVCT
jgi:hypothetical protein